MAVRIKFISLCLIVGLLLMTGRLFFVQVIKGDDYSKKSAQQSRRRSIVHAKRGMIRDRSGVILAESIAKKVELKDIGLSDDKKKGNSKKVKRLYPFDGLAASVVGYVGTDGEGLAGIEYAFEDYLKGEDGWDIVLKDGRNRKHSRLDMPGKDPIDGADVYLTLDLNIQKIVEKVLSQAVKKLGAKNGMCVVMDPATGEVLAMANMPGFNPNIWKSFPHAYRKNSCVGYNYEPGSTFKIITAASAVEENLKSENDTIDANGGRYEVYDQVIRDHDAYGKITFQDAISYSSNVCFAKIANELGNDRFYKYIKDFGFGAETGLRLPGEEAGIVHPIKNWSGRTRVTMAMGQEISATLIQMVAAFGVVANGGVLLQPKIINRVVNNVGEAVVDEGQIARRRVISNKTAARLRSMMKGVVEYGTAKKIAIDGMQIAGKTGTSQKIDPETGAYSNDLVWASFIGFVPADKPELVCGVVIDEPANGEAGGAAAGPVFAQVFKQIVSHPHLDYAEKLLESADAVKFVEEDESGRRYPDLCGMNVNDASSFLTDEGISFEIIGRGQVISHQTPPAGKVFSSKSGLILYTQRDYIDSEYETNDIRVPYCVGKDLRDAVNAVNLKGLSPYVKGAGIVRRQAPISGSLVSSMEICTLFCSFEG